MLGLTFQQIQNYEKGQNRIGCSRIYELSKVLDVPVSFFFDDLPGDKAPGTPPGVAEAASAPYDNEAFTKRETLEMVRSYYRIADPQVRKRMAELIKAVAKQQD
jgi:transcriptional regulator with XRE-family HTH domain